MSKDFNEGIIDNGYCEIDSKFFTSKVEHDYNDDFYDEEVFDDEISEEDECKDFGIANIQPMQPIFLNNKVKYSGYFTYSELGRSLFKVLINGLGNFKPEYLAEKVTEVKFDENSIEISILCDSNLVVYLSNEINLCHGEYDFRADYVKKLVNSDIIIQQLDSTGCVVMEYKFYNAIISSVDFDGISYGDDEYYVKVIFSYEYFLVNNV